MNETVKKIKEVQQRRAALEMAIIADISKRIDELYEETGLSPCSIDISMSNVAGLGGDQRRYIVSGCNIVIEV